MNLELLNNVMSIYPITGTYDKDLEVKFDEAEKFVDHILESHDWGTDLDKNLPRVGEFLENSKGSVLSIHTPDWKFLYDTNPVVKIPNKVKIAGSQQMNTTFYTWDEVMKFIKQWKSRDFNYQDGIKKLRSFNRTFRIIKVYNMVGKGFLISNQFDVTYPEKFLMENILFSKNDEISRDDNKERSKKKSKPTA